jgi:hypothetical protein
MEAVSTSETSVNLYQTARRNIPEDSHVHDTKLLQESPLDVRLRNILYSPLTPSLLRLHTFLSTFKQLRNIFFHTSEIRTTIQSLQNNRKYYYVLIFSVLEIMRDDNFCTE